MRTAEEIAKDIVLSIDTYDDQCVARIAEFIRAARIEAVEEFRRRVFLELDWEERAATEPDFRVRLSIAALPALPEGT